MTYRTAALLIAGVLASGAFTAPALADVVYDQPGTSAACAGACWTSSAGATGGFQTYDDFTLTGDAGITGATWRGFIKPSTGGPVDPAVTTWNVSFSADSAGTPGTILYSHDFAAANVTATLLGVGDFGGPVNVYEFSVALPTAFAASAGTTYWFSPFAMQPDFFPFFSWSPAANTSGSSFQVLRPTGTTFVRPGDRAFSLSAVPEPQTWALMITGFCGAGVILRSRRRVAA